jgi:putative Ca2+/H+ antiporter (TMEM165/GDT1 family)
MVMLLTGKMSTMWLFILAVVATNIMNAVSVSIGALIPLLVPEKVLSLVVIAMFTYFGVKMCKKGLKKKKESNAGGNDTTSTSSDGGDSSDSSSDLGEALEKLEAFNEKKEPLLPP